MKTNFKCLLKKMSAMVVIIALVLSFSNRGVRAQETWDKGQKVSYIPTTNATTYKSSDWTKNLINLYQLTWYETPTRQVLKGEFMLVQLRTIQESLKRRGLSELSASKETLDFKDKSTLSASAQEEAKILKSLGILTGTSDGYIKICKPIKRSEAAKVLSITNTKILKITSLKTLKFFTDIKGNWAEKSINIAYQIGLLNGSSNNTFEPNKSLTLEQTLQILENEIGYYGITRVDVAKAMNETFKVTLNTDLSNSIISQSSYTKYEEKMKKYGFDIFYNNESAKTSETVTKAEALKMAIGVIINSNDITSRAEFDDEYANATWVNHAKYFKITTEDINSTNYMNKATYMDVISYFENCKIKFLKNQPIKTTDTYFTDISKYSVEQQTAIKDMLANEIIYPLADKLSGNNNIFKGQLNELVVNFIEKYSTICQKGDKININVDKMPSNAYQYPYILSNVDKAIYEIPLFKYESDAGDAAESYLSKGWLYPQIVEKSQEFFNTVLNVDYNTITESSLKENVADFFVFPPNDDAIKKYVSNVKNNKIVISGNAITQMPIMYYDGFNYRIRMKVTFEIQSSTTKDNLIYLDYLSGLKKTYNENKYELVVDYYMESAGGTNTMYMTEMDIYNGIINKENCGIIEEKRK